MGEVAERSEAGEGVRSSKYEKSAEIAAECPLSHGYAVPALPKGEPRGGRCPPGAVGKSAGIRQHSRPVSI